MKIAFNPSTVAALIAPPNNKDITFDLRGHNIFARGVKFCGTDTNTWRDIKINNVSIGSNTLDLRDGDNTTLTNINGIVTINSTWRPVVDNLTSDSTTSSLSANLGRILKALIDGKSNSGHTHDDRYLRLTGGTMDGNALITFADSGSWDTNKGPQGARGGLYWSGQSDYAKLYAEETAGDNLDLVIQFGDDNSNGLSIRNNANIQTSYISAGGIITTGTFKGNLDWSYITNKPATATRWPSWDEIINKPNTFTPSDHNHDGRYVYNYGGTANVNGLALNQNALFMSTTSGITEDWWHILQAAWNDEYRWNSLIAFPTLNRNGMYYRSGLDDNTAWGAWVKLLDTNNYSSILDSRYYTESEINSLLDAKLNRQNLSYGTWNPRGYNLAADYHYNGGDLSISENGGKIYVSIDGLFYQNEGQYRVLDTSDVAGLKDNLTVHLYLSSTDTTWWPLIWGGSSHNNTSDSTGEVYKSYDVLSWLTSTQTLYATRMRTTSVDLNDNRGIFLVTSGGTSPLKGIKLPYLENNGIGIFSRVGNGADEGGIVLSEDTCVIYNSFDTGWGLSVRDKDINLTDISGDDTIAFGVRQDYRAYSLGGFEKSGSDNSYVLLGGGGHSKITDLSVSNADTVDGYHASSLVKFYLSPMANDAPADSAKSWFINTMPSASGAIVYNVPGSEKTIIAGKSSGAFGHMLQLNYDDTYLRILRYYNSSWKSTNWEKISAGYADSSGNTDLLDGYHASGLFTNLSNSGNNISITIGGTNKTLTVGYASTATLVSKSLKWTDATGTVLSYNGGTEKSITSLNFPYNQIALNFRHPGDGYATKILYMTAGNEALVFAAQNSVTSFIFKSGANITNSNLWYDQVPTPTLQLKGLSAYINKLIADGSVPAFNFLVNGSSRFDGKLWQLYSTRTDPNATCIRDSAIACFGEYDDDAMWIGNNTNNGTWILVSFKGDEDRPSKNYLYNLSLLPLGGNVGIGTNSPTEKLTVNGWIGTNGIYTNRTGSSTDGGVSLYSNVDPMTYGIAFRGTGTYGTHGYVTSASDWATYLTMNDSTTRGWIFRRGDTNVASIAGSGNMAIGLHLEFSNGAHISTNRSTDYHYGYTFNLGDNTKSIGMYSGPVGEAGGVVISPDGCLIYNSSDCGYNLQVRDKDLGSDLTNIATLTFGIELSGYYAWSRGGFKKNGSSDSYVLLGGGGHKAESSLRVAYASSAGNADTVDGYHSSSFLTKHTREGAYNIDHLTDFVTRDLQPKSEINIEGTKPYDGWGIVTVLKTDNGTAQLVFDGGNNFYFRSSYGTENRYVTSAWKQVAALDSKVADSDKLDGIHANGLLTALSNSNNGISITVGGTTKSVSNISVNYANSAGNADTTDGVHITWAGELTSTNHLVAWEADGSALRDINPANISVGYASSAGNADTATNAYHLRINSANTWSTWYWAGLSGQPSWLWGSNDGTNMYVWDPNNFNVHTALYLRSLGNLNCQTGRTLNYGDVYTYNTITGNTGSPTDYTSVIGFGRGIAGTVEIAGGWCNTGLYWRSLRDCCEDWYSWRTVLDSSNYTGYVDNYYWANVKISTSSSTTTSPTVHTLTATRVCAGHNPEIDNSISCSNWFRSSGATGWYNTTYLGGWYMSDTSWIRAHNNVGIYTGGQIYSPSSIRMGNIYLLNTDEINNGANGWLHLNYRSSGNIGLCWGGGNVGIGTVTPSYKLDVNGLMRASGFHHSSMDSNNYMLLAGGGYKSFGGDYDHPVFLGYLNLDHGDDGTISSSFYCLGYSVSFTYTRGGNYCRIYIPDTSYQTFYIRAATASVNYSGGGMDTWTGYRRGDGAWWLHCYAYGSNEVRVKGFRLANDTNDSWWGGNPLWSSNGGANRITVCIFGYVTFK